MMATPVAARCSSNPEPAGSRTIRQRDDLSQSFTRQLHL
jgi:hypothetical protein